MAKKNIYGEYDQQGSYQPYNDPQAQDNKGSGQNKHISPQERKELYTMVMHQLGAPKRGIELTEEMLDSYLRISIEDYSNYVNNWMTEEHWADLQNLDMSSEDVAFAFLTRTLDFERSFSIAYSKQVGLGANAPSEWELKRDYITIEPNTQVYSIPANREINEVLWETPPMINSHGYAATFAGGVFAPGAFGWNYMGSPARRLLPAFTTMLRAQDISLKKRLLGSELTYRITAGPNGTKWLYLYPVPGSTKEITAYNSKHLAGHKVWYFYYDTTNKDPEKCIKENDDIIRMPSQVPLQTLTWDNLNSVSRNYVRRLLLCEAMIGLAKVRGKFSGELKAGDVQLNLDYRSLAEQGENDKRNLYEQLKAHLDKISYRQVMEDKAITAENLNKALSYIPFKKHIIYK